MFFGCIVLNGNALHAVVLFRNTKSEKKRGKEVLLFDLHKLAVRCLLTKAELLSPFSLSLSLSLSRSLFLFHVVLWILVTFHSMQSLQSPML